MDLILKYFPHLTPTQISQFEALYGLYSDWNQKINVISRKDIENLYEHHVLPSLGIAQVIHFQKGTSILDVGTGGGFPGIPLAILFPEVNFTLIDSIGKKIKVASEVSKAIALENTVFKQTRLEEEKGQYDFIVSRAVMTVNELVKQGSKNILKRQINALPNGIICLKGGEISNEIRNYKNIAEIFPLSNYFKEEYFKTKKIIYIPVFK